MARRELEDGEARPVGEVGRKLARQCGRRAAFERRPRVEVHCARGRDRERERDQVFGHWARLSSPPDMKELVVISPLSDWTCRECQGERGPARDGGARTALPRLRGAGPSRLPRPWRRRAHAPGQVGEQALGGGDLLMSGMERSEARAAVRDEVDRMLADWRGGD